MVQKYNRASTTLLGTTAKDQRGIENIRSVFYGTNAMYMASSNDILFYFGAYLVGLAPFLSFKGVDAYSLPWMTRDYT